MKTQVILTFWGMFCMVCVLVLIRPFLTHVHAAWLALAYLVLGIALMTAAAVASVMGGYA